MKVYPRNLYRLHEPYDEDQPEYDCMRPAQAGDFGVFDAWICNKQGRVHPDYNVSPVPIRNDSFNPVPLHELES